MANIAARVNKPAKLVACIQAHNEEEFIGLNLQNHYDVFDKIIIIEGAVANRSNATTDGHSTDRTVEIIEDFKQNHDPAKKILFIKIKRHWRNLEEMKQTFLDLSSDGDWIFIIDADEFYKPEDIQRVRKAIDLQPNASEFVPNFLHFYHDYNHIAVPGPEWQPQHQRIFKYVRGMKYNSHPVVTDPDGQCTYFSPQYQHRRVMLNNFFIYHYGYARNNMDEIMKQKQEYYEKELAGHGGANKKFDQKIKDWFAGTEPVLKYEEYNHVKVIEQKPIMVQLRNLNVVSDWRSDKFYSKVLAGEEYGNIWLCMNKLAQPHMNFYHNGMNI